MAGGEDGSPAAAAPLLLLPAAREERRRRARCREGCPGCRVEEASKSRAGVPYLNFFYIWVVCLAAGQSGSIAHTFLPIVPGVTYPPPPLLSLGFLGRHARELQTERHPAAALEASAARASHLDVYVFVSCSTPNIIPYRLLYPIWAPYK
jgi:hypothetical protein